MTNTALVQEPGEIPNKLYFRIGEVSRLVGVKPYVLRYWESEFSMLGPKKSGTGHRLYRRKDVELALVIKELLYEKRFTIEGARKHLEARTRTAAPPPPPPPTSQGELFQAPPPAILADIKKELLGILKLLK
jgi:DNA-binding transcriptional MerR regulator